MSKQSSGTSDRLLVLIRRHWLFLIVIVTASFVWTMMFIRAATEFVANPNWPRAVWNGEGSIDIFGYTLAVHFEGWADHDYFYHSWADQFLSGRMPYTDDFNRLFRGSTEYNVIYFFPPLYVYMCALGEIIHPDIGIGLLISGFGFLTSFPVYGIATYLSQNRDVGAVSAAMYLLNPIVLYHTAFEWLNPAPFVFFAVLSFYLVIKNRRVSGALALTTAAFFKQTAFFLALPLVAVLLKKPPGPLEMGDDSEDTESTTKKPTSDDFDLKGFAKIAIIVLLFAGALSMPYLIDFSNYFFYIFQRVGATLLRDLTTPPPINNPITPAVVLIILGAPEWLIQAVNLITYYSVALTLGILPLLAMMLLEVKDDRNLEGYWRRMLFLTLVLLFWAHFFSPRGIYKYYMVALVPFFSIMSTSAICRREPYSARISLPMIAVPLLISFLVLVPDRNFYLLFLFLIILGYVLHKPFSEVYQRVTSPIRRLDTQIRNRAAARNRE
ncbi:MAG: hypothetical protein ACE5H4_05385 [Candidatus Thorarchaeota archaeon]